MNKQLLTKAKALALTLYSECKLPPNRYQLTYLESPHVVSFILRGIPPGQVDSIFKASRRINYAMGGSTQAPCRIHYDNGLFFIEIRRIDRLIVNLDSLKRRNLLRDDLHYTLGFSTTVQPVTIDYTSNVTSHILNGGSTGSGKTVTHQNLTYQMLRSANYHDIQVVILDGKGGADWEPFNQKPYVGLAHPIMTKDEEFKQFFAWLKWELHRREQEHINSPKTFIVIDELKTIIERANNALDVLSDVASLGRSLGLNLVVATQYPTIGALKGDTYLKRNMTTRLCGKVDDSTSSVNILGIPSGGAEKLTGHGDYLMVNAEGKLLRLAIAKINEPDVLSLPTNNHIPRLPLDEMDNDMINSSGREVIIQYPDPRELAYGLFYANSKTDLRLNGNPEIGDNGKRKEISKPRVERMWSYTEEIKTEVNNIGIEENKPPKVNFLNPDLVEIG